MHVPQNYTTLTHQTALMISLADFRADSSVKSSLPQCTGRVSLDSRATLRKKVPICSLETVNLKQKVRMRGNKCLFEIKELQLGENRLRQKPK